MLVALVSKHLNNGGRREITFCFLFLMQRQYNGATFHASTIKGCAACGKRSTKKNEDSYIGAACFRRFLTAQLTVWH